MAEPRPFPPSPRRLALARAAGLVPASPLLVGAAAVSAGALALTVLGGAATRALGGAIATACTHADGGEAANLGAPLRRLVPDALAYAAPVLIAAAVAAIVVHLAQTRAFWVPRRPHLPGAPALPAHRATRASLELVAALVTGTVTLGWLWVTSSSLANLVQSPHAIGVALLALLTSLAIMLVALGIVDALVRALQHGAALRMTRTEKREDDRLAGADPRWRQRQLAVLRETPATAVAAATVLLVGDDVAVAVAFDPTRQPVPTRTITGRRAEATQLLALARRYRIAVHRDAPLTARLARSSGPVPASDWGALADVLVAVGRR